MRYHWIVVLGLLFFSSQVLGEDKGAPKNQKEMKTKQEEMMKKTGEMNKKEGETFLAGNKKKEGVLTLPSGLQYKVMKQGSGKKPKSNDTVTTHYKGTLIDGTEFDSSYRRGHPVSLPVTGVIA